jgi:hypothetical protein
LATIFADAFEQMGWIGSIVTIGLGLTLTILVSTAAAHAPEAFDVSVSVISPVKLAFTVKATLLGVAVAEELLNVPPPLAVHVAVVAPPLIDAPLSAIVVGVVAWQIKMVSPASTKGLGEIVMVRSANTGGQGEVGEELVSLRVTVPVKSGGGV